MRLSVFVNHTNPPKVEEVVMEDVANFVLNDSGMVVSFNTGDQEVVRFRSNDGEGDIDWGSATVIATRVGLKIEL